ncbi:MAG TPA: CpaF family protein [Armatimonadota bacterium]
MRTDLPPSGEIRAGGPVDVNEAKQTVHHKLLNETEFGVLQRLNKRQLGERIAYLVDVVAAEGNLSLTGRIRTQIEQEVLYEVVGYGPMQTLLDDPEISEIMVNGPTKVFVERNGRLELTDRTFVDDDHVMRIIEKIISPLGRRLDESVPMVDARLPDGSRVNAIIPPLALNGPCITIRKFAAERLTPQDLVAFGTMTPEMCTFLEACVKARLNGLVSGGTGSGKTTTLNVLSSFIPDNERIVTIEDAAELQLQQPHVVTLESRPPNVEGRGSISIRDLVRNSLRMRPDRIVVGEVRGGEALDMLQAMNTGHDGSLSTLHANSPRDALARLETMVLMAGMELPMRAIREQIAGALHLIVQQARLRDGSRRIIAVTEVQRMEGEHIVLQDIFKFERHGMSEDGKVIGSLLPTGVRPLFMELIEAEGLSLESNIFQPRR